MTLAQWITRWKYRALSDLALQELFLVLAEEGKDGKGWTGVPDQESPGGN